MDPHIRPGQDKIGRRRRDQRQSTSKRISPQQRDLLWFQKLQEHGPLSSSYLHAFSKHIRRSEKRARDRLTDLFHEDQTPHKGAYLDRPIQQFRSFDARYQDLVFDLAPPALAALKGVGLRSEYGVSGRAPGNTGSWYPALQPQLNWPPWIEAISITFRKEQSWRGPTLNCVIL